MKVKNSGVNKNFKSMCYFNNVEVGTLNSSYLKATSKVRLKGNDIEIGQKRALTTDAELPTLKKIKIKDSKN